MNKKTTTIVINGYKISTLMASMTTRDQFQMSTNQPQYVLFLLLNRIK